MPKSVAAADRPANGRRKRRSGDEILERIIAAAGSEFEENGYAGATTAAIARRADVTEAQIFRLFPSKAELFREAIFQPLNRHFADFHARHAVEQAGGGSFRELAHRYIDELHDFMDEHSRMLMSLIVAQAYAQGSGEGLPQLEGLRAYFEQGATTMSRRTGVEPRVRPELMVRVSFAAVLASVMFKDWLFPPGLGSEEEIRRAVAEFTIDGIRANEAS